MLSLVQIQNDQVVASSRQVAEHFCKDHSHLLRDIRKLRTEFNDANSKDPMFIDSSYIDRGVTKPEYWMNLEGFRLLASDYTGRRSRRIKRDIIQESIRSQEKTYAELTPINEVMMRFLNDIRFLSSIGENDETKILNLPRLKARDSCFLDQDSS